MQPTIFSRVRNILVSHQAVPLTFYNKIALMADQCKQRVALCHIELVKDHGGHSPGVGKLWHDPKKLF